MTQIMTERIYVAIGGHGWGKGLSVDEAKRTARRHCKRGTRLWVWKLPAGAHSARVTGLGEIRWQLQEGADSQATAELIERNGRRIEVEPVDDDGVAEWQNHVAEQKAQRASAEEQGA